eukprot:jgi/Ulvmu1/5375/UM022_0170.1
MCQCRMLTVAPPPTPCRRQHVCDSVCSVLQKRVRIMFALTLKDSQQIAAVLFVPPTVCVSRGANATKIAKAQMALEYGSVSQALSTFGSGSHASSTSAQARAHAHGGAVPRGGGGPSWSAQHLGYRHPGPPTAVQAGCGAGCSHRRADAAPVAPVRQGRQASTWVIAGAAAVPSTSYGGPGHRGASRAPGSCGSILFHGGLHGVNSSGSNLPIAATQLVGGQAAAQHHGQPEVGPDAGCGELHLLYSADSTIFDGEVRGRSMEAMVGKRVREGSATRNPDSRSRYDVRLEDAPDRPADHADAGAAGVVRRAADAHAGAVGVDGRKAGADEGVARADEGLDSDEAQLPEETYRFFEQLGGKGGRRPSWEVHDEEPLPQPQG